MIAEEAKSSQIAFGEVFNTVEAETLETRRANAAIVVLCRNSELSQIRRAVREFEDRFNRRFGYPYVFINDEPFTEEFKAQMKRTTMNPIEFVTTVDGSWGYPSHINITLADECRARMAEDGVHYGGSLSYRNMCRFYSGWFFRHPALAKYKWYMRLEPGVQFYCDVDYDPFLFMEENGKQYGFVITIRDIPETIPTLWSTVKDYASSAGVRDSTLLRFFADDETGDYNTCHFWSNFEIANLDLWRDQQYVDYFEYLDNSGGFFYERWGDAPIHSLYLGLALRKEQVHFFNDIGYRHDNFFHCSEEGDLAGKCICPENEPSVDFEWPSCLERWLNYEERAWTFEDPL
ncbi:alpha 1,2-mannosyltransferase 2.4.1 [Quaeritorhiza haematococci]|nr:alpha 1,2-mannosyltransferase 2.4.1 [Quaeritorhiza haematococci]